MSQAAEALRLTKSGPKNNGLVSRFFTSGEDPIQEITWELRDVKIEASNGSTIFEEKGVEVPSFWSQAAVSIVASKYFTLNPKTGVREKSVRELVRRVTQTISKSGFEQGYFADDEERELFNDELSYLLLHQYASFNSPVWFNVGIQPKPQCSACFILSVNDTMESLLDLQRVEGMLFKYGSGAGTNLSKVRSTKEKLGGGGTPSGPVSFMRGFDAWANIIKSGGKTRRAAKMQILEVDHPDIRQFINCKKDEEERVAKLIEAGAGSSAYDSAAFQNANLSVRVSDDFMKAVESDSTYWTRYVQTGEPCEELRAREILAAIARGAWTCGDPGLQYDTTINEWHTCPASGRINASNPCSEYMSLDNSACNLSSINLLKFLKEDGSFDTEAFRRVVRLLIVAQDILVDMSSYPTQEIATCAKEYRQLGLGYANLGALILSKGYAYDSDDARGLAAAITALMTGEAYATSAELAASRGAFKGYKKNRAAMNSVLRRHRAALSSGYSDAAPLDILQSAQDAWNIAVKSAEKHGVRNSQTTVLAPTGTISFMMDCDTTGIEPDIALVKYKRLSGGGTVKLVNRSVALALESKGYSKKETGDIVRYLHEHDTIEGAPSLRTEDLAIFDCALKPVKGSRSIHYRGHLLMMSAVQPFLSGAISKTVNLPKETTEEEIADIYIEAWRLGLKSVALYRDGSKLYQPLVQKGQDDEPKAAGQPSRRRLPDERRAFTHKFSIAGLEGYITVGLFEDGTPGEVFIVVAKEGSTLSGVMDAFATSISLALQYGVPLKALVRKFAHSRFEPAGLTSNRDIPMAKSLIDYLFKWLALKFLPSEELEQLGMAPSRNENSEKPGDMLKATFVKMEDAPPCTSCGSDLMVRQGGCYVCLNCSAQGGCG